MAAGLPLLGGALVGGALHSGSRSERSVPSPSRRVRMSIASRRRSRRFSSDMCTAPRWTSASCTLASIASCCLSVVPPWGTRKALGARSSSARIERAISEGERGGPGPVPCGDGGPGPVPCAPVTLRRMSAWRHAERTSRAMKAASPGTTELPRMRPAARMLVGRTALAGQPAIRARSGTVGAMSSSNAPSS